MEDRLNLIVDVRSNEVGPRNANVRANLPVRMLIDNIKDKFNLDGSYALLLREGGSALAEEQTLAAAGVSQGARLLCVYVEANTGTAALLRAAQRLPFTRKYRRVYFQDQRALTEYELGWQPAILGRRDQRNPAANRLLGVDLDSAEALPTVSRQHAALTESTGTFYIETIHARNPVYVNEKRVPPGYRQALANGSLVRLGQVRLVFRVIS